MTQNSIVEMGDTQFGVWGQSVDLRSEKYM